MYYCDNETVHGVEYQTPPTPNPRNPILITDMTSNFFSKEIDVTKFGIIYAGSQKNYGIPGLIIVIVRNDLLKGDEELMGLPSEYSYKKQAKNPTSKPPVFSILFAREYLKYMKSIGGLKEIEKLTNAKSKLIYDLIDNSNGFYKNVVEKSSRSRLNIPCFIQNNDKALTETFKKEAHKRGIIQIAGHRSMGGLRFSIYNGMPMDGVLRLKNFMLEFQKKHQMKPKL
jgi:phosphoserine aminotransferase